MMILATAEIFRKWSIKRPRGLLVDSDTHDIGMRYFIFGWGWDEIIGHTYKEDNLAARCPDWTKRCQVKSNGISLVNITILYFHMTDSIRCWSLTYFREVDILPISCLCKFVVGFLSLTFFRDGGLMLRLRREGSWDGVPHWHWRLSWQVS